MHEAAGCKDLPAAFLFQYPVRNIGVTSDIAKELPEKMTQMVRPPCFFIAEDNDRGTVCQFAAGMDPEKALMSGTVPIFIYLDIGFIALVYL